MPKNNKSVGRKKWIAGGIIGFASVTLIATGFATWVIGNQITEDKDNVTVAVDTAKNDSVTLDIAVDSNDNSLFLGGKDTSGADSGISSSVVKYDKESGEEKAEDLSVKYTYTITAGADYWNSLNDGGINITFSVHEDSAIKLDVNLEAEKANATGLHSGALTYLNLPETVNVKQSDFGEPQDDGTYKVTKSATLSFSWGSYFGGKNPITYYNELFQTGGDSGLDANDAADLQAVIDELNTMSTALNSKTLTLKAEMSKVGA